MQKCTHREVRILLGGLVRLVGFLRTLLGFKVTSIPLRDDWLEIKFSFKADYFADGVDYCPAPGVLARHATKQAGPKNPDLPMSVL